MIENRDITYKDIKPYIESGLVTENTHPENENLRIFNYTPECQFDSKWDDVTLQCRGLILDISSDTIIARPFPKFFNYDEYLNMGYSIPGEIPRVHDKMDGSLGILYYVDNVPHIATRGSFTSDQAKWATKWWHTNIPPGTPTIGVTHLFEIIFNENRIVVKYDYEGLVYLGSVDNGTGKTIPGYVFPGPSFVREYDFVSVEQLANLNLENSEGFVLHYPESDLRLKIKFEEYKRLHKILTGLSEKGLWELLQVKGLDILPREVIEDVPDEFYAWMEFKLDKLKEDYRTIEKEARSTIDMMKDEIRPGGAYETRRDQAQLITVSKYPAVAFQMLDGRDYSKLIFQMIKPKGSNTYNENEQ